MSEGRKWWRFKNAVETYRNLGFKIFESRTLGGISLISVFDYQNKLVQSWKVDRNAKVIHMEKIHGT